MVRPVDRVLKDTLDVVHPAGVFGVPMVRPVDRVLKVASWIQQYRDGKIGSHGQTRG